MAAKAVYDLSNVVDASVSKAAKTRCGLAGVDIAEEAPSPQAYGHAGVSNLRMWHVSPKMLAIPSLATKLMCPSILKILFYEKPF